MACFEHKALVELFHITIGYDGTDIPKNIVINLSPINRWPDTLMIKLYLDNLLEITIEHVYIIEE